MSSTEALDTLQTLLVEIAHRHHVHVHLRWSGVLPEDACVELTPHGGPPQSGLGMRLIDLCDWRDRGVLHDRLGVYLRLLGEGEAQGVAA